jgi:hypothetical protein
MLLLVTSWKEPFDSIVGRGRLTKSLIESGGAGATAGECEGIGAVMTAGVAAETGVAESGGM